jgi:hypothetical protein
VLPKRGSLQPPVIRHPDVTGGETKRSMPASALASAISCTQRTNFATATSETISTITHRPRWLPSSNGLTNGASAPSKPPQACSVYPTGSDNVASQRAATHQVVTPVGITRSTQGGTSSVSLAILAGFPHLKSMALQGALPILRLTSPLVALPPIVPASLVEAQSRDTLFSRCSPRGRRCLI